MEKVYERIVSDKMAGTRLDVYLVRGGFGLTRSQVEKLIKDGKVLVNDKSTKPGYKLKKGDVVYAKIEIKPKPQVIGQYIDVPIIYEDEDVVIIDKPVGMVVHPAKGNLEGTIINALVYRYKDLPQTSDKTRPGVVHRLDKETSGLLVVAKTDKALRSLASQMADKTARRTYWAVVWGSLPQDQGIIEAPIGRHSIDRKRMAVTPFHSKPAITEYRVLKRYNKLATFLEVKLHTGRTHQIRVHFEYIGYPIVGDPTYSGRSTRKIFNVVPTSEAPKVKKMLEIMQRQALHARKLSFIHPSKLVRVEFESPIPEDFKKLLDYLDSTLSSPAP